MNRVTAVTALGGVVGGYGGCAVIAGRYLYPTGDDGGAWMYVTKTDSLKVGESIPFQTPAGSTVTIARQGEGETTEDFAALSSTCPHLGCKVHWEGQNNRFFCPCHNGVFDANGTPTAGPPADAKQSLLRFPLKVEGGMLFVELPREQLA